MATNPYEPTFSGGALPAAMNPSNFSGDKLEEQAGSMQGATQYTPDDNALVSSQLSSLLSSSSPYISRARTRAAEYSSSRGLLNSTMGAQAGEAAAIDAALPIAQQDATTNFTAQRENAAAVNQFALDANRFKREGALTAAKVGYDLFGQDRQNAFTAGESAAQRLVERDRLQADTAIRQGQLDVSRGQLDVQRGDLGLREDDLALRREQQQRQQQQQELENSRQQADTYARLQETYLNYRTQLETNPNLDQAAKAEAIRAMSEWFNASFLQPMREQYGNPASWPDFTAFDNAAGTGGTSPGGGGWVPAPAPPPAPVFVDRDGDGRNDELYPPSFGGGGSE